MECTFHLECTWSGVGVYFYWRVFWPSPWSGILVYPYNIRSVVGVYTPVGVVTEWLWSVHSKLECTLRQGKGHSPIISTVKLLIEGIQIPKPQCFRLVLQLSLPIHWSKFLENEDVAGAGPTADAPTSSEWSTILLPIEARLFLKYLTVS